MKTYYHITSIKNESSILRHGLKCNEEGHIFLLDTLEVCDSLAIYQLGLDKFSIIEVSSKGFKGNLIRDEVAEFTANHQFICQQEVIEPNHLKLLRQQTIDPFVVATRDNISLYNVLDENFNNLDFKSKILFLKDTHQSNKKYTLWLDCLLQDENVYSNKTN